MCLGPALHRRRRVVDRHLGDPHADALVQALRRLIAAAAPGDEGPDVLLEAEMPQARRARVEMLTDAVAQRVVALVVEVEVDVAQDVVAVDVADPFRSRSRAPFRGWSNTNLSCA